MIKDFVLLIYVGPEMCCFKKYQLIVVNNNRRSFCVKAKSRSSGYRTGGGSQMAKSVKDGGTSEPGRTVC